MPLNFTFCFFSTRFIRDMHSSKTIFDNDSMYMSVYDIGALQYSGVFLITFKEDLKILQLIRIRRETFTQHAMHHWRRKWCHTCSITNTMCRIIVKELSTCLGLSWIVSGRPFSLWWARFPGFEKGRPLREYANGTEKTSLEFDQPIVELTLLTMFPGTLTF